MKVHVREGDIHLHDTRTRLPFKYGIATMTSAPHVFLHLRVEAGGRTATGIAADGLPPKWFTKDPARPVNDEIHEMLRVIENALGLALGVRAASAFDAWRQVYEAQSAWGRREGLPPLLTQFGTSLVERALIEAVCRAAGRPFHELLRDGTLGMCLEGIHPALAGRRLAELLPERPRELIIARHTVGLLDPLTEDEIPAAERLDDGLPQSLEACARTYGLRHFKVKVFGDLDRDLTRLRRIALVLQPVAPPDHRFTLDGNEQFRSLAEFRAYWEALRRSPDALDLLGRVLFVEQPLHRDVAISDAAEMSRGGWAERPPIIIDESDAELDSLPRALDLGYAGTSHKNCKGVFKSVANAALLKHAEAAPHPTVMSGEDLANIGPVALLQDLTVCAALGIASVERNGHHYFAGLSMWPADVREEVLARHGDLYRPSRDGWPTLRIEDGRVALASLARAPFGVGLEVPVERFLTPDAWRRAHPL